jgi:hypothetical protein
MNLNKKRMNFGKWIVVSFAGFALFIGALVTVCMRQDINLVAPDYYKQELAYQKQIERKQNANALNTLPKIEFVSNRLTISFKDFNQISKGELKLFRPSDARLDQTFDVHSSNDPVQTFEISIPQRGLYKASLTWSMAGKEYFVEETIYL